MHPAIPPLPTMEIHAVGAVIVLPGDRVLFQHRDDDPAVMMGGHWGLFGGQIEYGETPADALVRELGEELEFNPSSMHALGDIIYSREAWGGGHARKFFFEVPCSMAEEEAFVQHEGMGRCAFERRDVVGQPLVIPWDLFGAMLHWMAPRSA